MRLSDLYFSWWLRPGATRSLSVGGLNRSYVVHAPKGHDPKVAVHFLRSIKRRDRFGTAAES